MLTYQLHTRIFKIYNEIPFSFPNQAIIEVKFGPPNAFGADSSPGRTIVKAHRAELSINANTGKWQAQSEPPLKPLDLRLETPNHIFILNGDNLRIEFRCEDIDELTGTLMSIKWILPALMNLEFADPPIVIEAHGQLGESKFRWEVKPEDWLVELWPKTEELLEDCVANSINKITIFQGKQNRRLAAAIRYFYTGSRLAVSGESPWEFMAETILNYAKTLEILFATSEASKDDVRRELSKIGYTQEEIEGDYIPILELRRVDVAHPKVALYKSADLKVLYRYIHQSEDKLRKLLTRVIEMVSNATYEVPQDDLSLNSEDRRHMTRLVNQMASRLDVEDYPN